MFDDFEFEYKGLTFSSTKEDIINDKRKYRKTVATVADVFDYNWLEEE